MCLDDHQIRQEELESVREMSEVCSQIVLTCLSLARIGRLHTPWSLNKFPWSFTKWAAACDRRLVRLSSYVHHTSDYRHFCHVGNTTQHCRLGLFQDLGGILCIFASRTFVLISVMCKKQTSLLALDLWDVVIEVLRSSTNTEPPTNPAAGNCSRNHKANPKTKGKTRCWAIERCGLRHHKRTLFSRWVLVLHLWRQWSRHPNDH